MGALRPGQALAGFVVTLAFSAAWRWTRTPEQPTSARRRTACTSAWLCWPPCWAASRAPLLSLWPTRWAWNPVPPTGAAHLDALGYPGSSRAHVQTTLLELDWTELSSMGSNLSPSGTSILYSFSTK